MQSVLGLPPAAFCLHLAAKSNAAIASNVLLSTPVSRRNTWPFSFLTESNLIAASLWAATNHPDLKKGLCKRSNVAAALAIVANALGRDHADAAAAIDKTDFFARERGPERPRRPQISRVVALRRAAIDANVF